MARKPKAPEAGLAPEAAEAPVETAALDSAPVDDALMAVVDATDPLAQPVPEPPETVAPEQPSGTPAPARRSAVGGIVLGMLLGAAVAAAAGVGTLRYAPRLLGLNPGQDPAALAAELATLKTELSTVTQRLGALDPTVTALADQVTALQSAPAADLSSLEARISDLDQRMAALAAAPTAGTGGGVDPAEMQALKDQIAALQSGTVASDKAMALAAEAEQRLAEARDAAQALQAETQAARAATERQAALDRIGMAIERGTGFAEPLAALGGSVPSVLADHAKTGLPSADLLRASFPDAARAALAAAIQADMGSSWSERVGNFLRGQAGLRSLTPREGLDPDAILSRAEAALASGDLASTLDEISTLPEPAKAAMADWTSRAQVHLQAVQALADLAAQG